MMWIAIYSFVQTNTVGTEHDAHMVLAYFPLCVCTAALFGGDFPNLVHLGPTAVHSIVPQEVTVW